MGAASSAGPHGVVVIDKPAGWTSHDVVAKSRGVIGTRKVGHSGTLDPDAGVLVLGVGNATRLLRFLTELPKRYEGEIVLDGDDDARRCRRVRRHPRHVGGHRRSGAGCCQPPYRGSDAGAADGLGDQDDGKRLHELAVKTGGRSTTASAG